MFNYLNSFLSVTFSLLILFHGASAFNCADFNFVPKTHCISLVELYENTDGKLWKYDSNWLHSSNPCLWYGVECEKNNIVELNLAGNNLLGPIPASIGDISTLQSIDFSGNILTGHLPAEIGRLNFLVSLDLSNNKLIGSIPTEFGRLSALKILNAFNNRLIGPFS